MPLSIGFRIQVVVYPVYPGSAFGQGRIGDDTIVLYDTGGGSRHLFAKFTSLYAQGIQLLFAFGSVNVSQAVQTGPPLRAEHSPYRQSGFCWREFYFRRWCVYFPDVFRKGDFQSLSVL